MTKLFTTIGLIVGLSLPAMAATLNDSAGQNYVRKANIEKVAASGDYITGLEVWVNNKKLYVFPGERGLTREILFERSGESAVAWAESEFGVPFRAEGDGGGFTTEQETFDIKDKEGDVVGQGTRDVAGPNESANW